MINRMTQDEWMAERKGVFAQQQDQQQTALRGRPVCSRCVGDAIVEAIGQAGGQPKGQRPVAAEILQQHLRMDAIDEVVASLVDRLLSAGVVEPAAEVGQSPQASPEGPSMLVSLHVIGIRMRETEARLAQLLARLVL